MPLQKILGNGVSGWANSCQVNITITEEVVKQVGL